MSTMTLTSTTTKMTFVGSQQELLEAASVCEDGEASTHEAASGCEDGEASTELPINSHVYFPVPKLEDEQGGVWETGLVDDDAVVDTSASDAPPSRVLFCSESRISQIQKKAIDNFLPLGFAAALLVALAYPYPGKQLASYTLEGVLVAQAINTVFVFFVSGITLNMNALASGVQHWRSVVLGIVIIIGLTPLLGFVFVLLPLEPNELSAGLAIFCCVPTTLGVGVALTTASEGNAPVALILTVVTNLVGIVTMPYILMVILRGSNLGSFDPVKVVIKLLFTVFVPSCVGHMCSRCSVRCRGFVARHRVGLSLFSTTNLICIIWQTLSSASDVILQQSVQNVLVVVVLSSTLHVFLLAAIFALTSRRGLGLASKERVAVTIMGAQKSAPVAVTLISYIVQSPAQQGLLSIPSLIGQLCQIFIGSALVAAFRRVVKAEERAAEEAVELTELVGAGAQPVLGERK